jgi:hypothetical protein
MRTLLMNAAFSLAIGVAGLPGLASQASAQDMELRLDRHGPLLRMREACDPDVEDCNDDGYRYAERRGCTEDRALNKAEDMGIRRARVAYAGERTIRIRGRSYDGDRVFVTFGRERGCPVLER